MLNYGDPNSYGGNEFTAQPRLINGNRNKFKDPYGQNIEEYYP